MSFHGETTLARARNKHACILVGQIGDGGSVGRRTGVAHQRAKPFIYVPCRVLAALPRGMRLPRCVLIGHISPSLTSPLPLNQCSNAMHISV